MIARILVSREAFDADSAVVEGDDFRHLCKSLRRRVGDQVEVTDGAGRKRIGALTSVNKASATVELGPLLDAPQVVSRVSILSCVPRPERAAWLVEKCTELGVRGFGFFDAEHSARSMTAKGADRLRRVAKSAILQCGGAWLPELIEIGDFERLVGAVVEAKTSARPIWVLEPGAEVRLADIASSRPSSVTLILGPEGGLSSREVSQIVDAGGTAVALGDSLLRMETAAVSGASLLLAR